MKAGTRTGGGSQQRGQSIIIMDRLVKQPSESRGGVMQILHKVDI